MLPVYTLTIPPKPAPDSGQKTRSFSAGLVAYVTADQLWDGGEAQTDTIRPIWLQVVGTPGALHPFVMNLKAGRSADMTRTSASSSARSKPERIELLRSGGYHWHWQRTDHGAVVTAYLPELVVLDPGMIDPDTCAFVCLTPRWWVARHGEQAEAVRFVAYLRRRTRRPIFPDAQFARFLLERALAAGVAVRPGRTTTGFTARGLDQARLLPPLQVRAAQADLDAFLALTVKAWIDQAHEPDERSAA
jgi:hypothetical protein